MNPNYQEALLGLALQSGLARWVEYPGEEKTLVVANRNYISGNEYRLVQEGQTGNVVDTDLHAMEFLANSLKNNRVVGKDPVEELTAYEKLVLNTAKDQGLVQWRSEGEIGMAVVGDRLYRDPRSYRPVDAGPEVEWKEGDFTAAEYVEESAALRQRKEARLTVLGGALGGGRRTELAVVPRYEFRALPNGGRFRDAGMDEMNREVLWHHFNAEPHEVQHIAPMTSKGVREIKALTEWLRKHAEVVYDSETLTFTQVLNGYTAEAQRFKHGEHHYLHVSDFRGEYLYRAPYRELRMGLEQDRGQRAGQALPAQQAALPGAHEQPDRPAATPANAEVESPAGNNPKDILLAAGFTERRVAGWDALEREVNGRKQRIKWGDRPRGVDFNKASSYRLIEIDSPVPGGIPTFTERGIETSEELLNCLELLQGPRLEKTASVSLSM